MVKSFTRRPFASEFTVVRVVRIAAVMGTFFAAFLALIQLPFLRRAPAVVSAADGYFSSSRDEHLAGLSDAMDFARACSMDPVSTVAGGPSGGFVPLPTSVALEILNNPYGSSILYPPAGAWPLRIAPSLMPCYFLLVWILTETFSTTGFPRVASSIFWAATIRRL